MDEVTDRQSLFLAVFVKDSGEQKETRTNEREKGGGGGRGQNPNKDSSKLSA